MGVHYSPSVFHRVILDQVLVSPAGTVRLPTLQRRDALLFITSHYVSSSPSTGESLTLSKVKTQRVGVRSLFGYDPIDKQFKVLCMTSAGCIGDRVLYWKLAVEENQMLHTTRSCAFSSGTRHMHQRCLVLSS